MQTARRSAIISVIFCLLACRERVVSVAQSTDEISRADSFLNIQSKAFDKAYFKSQTPPKFDGTGDSPRIGIWLPGLDLIKQTLSLDVSVANHEGNVSLSKAANYRPEKNAWFSATGNEANLMVGSIGSEFANKNDHEIRFELNDGGGPVNWKLPLVNVLINPFENLVLLKFDGSLVPWFSAGQSAQGKNVSSALVWLKSGDFSRRIPLRESESTIFFVTREVYDRAVLVLHLETYQEDSGQEKKFELAIGNLKTVAKGW